MKQVSIVRTETGDDGTFGKLTGPAGFECYTAELPWRDADGDGKRDARVSCIKAGVYICRWTKSATRTNPDGSPESSYELLDVPDAAGVRIHPGNLAGDKVRGFLSDSEACILPGRAILDVEIPKERRVPGGRMKQKGVTSSRDTVTAFAALMGLGQFELTITWAPGVAPQEA